MLEQLETFGRYLGQSLRLMVGLPDYETYVAHMQNAHPDSKPMSYEEFFRERQQARYGGGQGRPVLLKPGRGAAPQAPRAAQGG